MKERPILFSAPMVLTILDGSKTQTRRIAKGVLARHSQTGEALSGLDSAGPRVSCRYGQPGDCLWVRETWSIDAFGGFHGRDGFGRWDYQIKYRADNSTKDLIYKGDYRNDPYCGLFDTQTGDWRPSIHMFRWASRIDLLIKSVRVERLQDISEADALAEGITYAQLPENPHDQQRARTWYRGLWEQINGAGSWEANPWVWVVEFERVKP